MVDRAEPPPLEVIAQLIHPALIDRTVNFFYKKMQFYSTRFSPNSDRQRSLQASAHSYLRQQANDRQRMPEAAE
jgi:hypothetical protein